jgi:ornithine carbamoyltransferase
MPIASAPFLSPAASRDVRTLRGRDLLSIRDLSAAELRSLIALAVDMKLQPARYDRALAGRTLALLFEKPSLRTRVSFDVAMYQLGGHAIYLGPAEIGLGVRESIADVAHTLERMVAGIMARTYAHATLAELADAAAAPVINGLSDFSHPCQAIADFQTVYEIKRRLADVRLAYIGDANNVANSLIFGAALLGVRMSIATPPGFAPAEEVLDWARRHEVSPGTACRPTDDPAAAAFGADVVYTDTWVSMGQEAEAARRRAAFAGYEVTAALMRHASPDAVLMHCLPAHRGEEVAAEVLDSPRSVVFQQAGNRLHAQKAVLYALMRTPEAA